MSCRAILHSTGQESIPLQLVRLGELTPKQCDNHFQGLTGECPTCKAMIEMGDLDAGGSYAEALLSLKSRGQSVAYRRFGYGTLGSVDPWRVCYWGHPPGYWAGVGIKYCQNPSTDEHSVNLAVIRKFYEQKFSPAEGWIVKVEPKLRKMGDPPRPYSPDLAIYSPEGKRMIAVEYQRSYEPYEKFCDRDDLRRSEGWASVDWWFDDTRFNADDCRRTVYEKSEMHRTHLSALYAHHFRCWIDPVTLKMQAEYGRSGELPPRQRSKVDRHIDKVRLQECKTSELIKQVERLPEGKALAEYRHPLRPSVNSDLDFRADLEYSLERERRIALAVIARHRYIDNDGMRSASTPASCHGSSQNHQASLARRRSVLPKPSAGRLLPDLSGFKFDTQVWSDPWQEPHQLMTDSILFPFKN